MHGTNQQHVGCVFLSLYTTVGLFSFPSIHSQVHTQVCHQGHIGQSSSYSTNFLDCMFWDRVSTELWAPLLDTLNDQWAEKVWLSLPPISTPCPWLRVLVGKPFLSQTETPYLTPFCSFSSISNLWQEPAWEEGCATLSNKCVFSIMHCFCCVERLGSGAPVYMTQKRRKRQVNLQTGLEFLLNSTSQTPGTGGYPRGALGQLA